MDERDERHDELERFAKQAFECSVAAIDAETRARLRRARLRALEDIGPGRVAWRPRPWPLAAAASVAAAAIALAVALRPGWPIGAPTDDPAVRVAAFADLELLLGEEELEMLEEELEFYAWLEEQPELRPVGAPDADDGSG